MVSIGLSSQDVLSKLSLLFDHYTTAQTRFDSHLATLRLHFKSIRTREEGLADLKSRKRSLASKIESVEKKLAKMGPENKELMKTTSMLKEHRSEMESLKVEVSTEEAAIGDFKRRTTKEAMGLKCGGMMELAEKMTIIAEVGRMIIDQIPLDETAPGDLRAEYHGHNRTDELLQEASRSISEVSFAPNTSGRGHSGAPLQRPELAQYQTEYGDDTTFERDHRYGGQRYDQQEIDEEPEQDDLYAGGASQYNNDAGANRTPIYASHQTTQPWLQQQQQQQQSEGSRDHSERFHEPEPEPTTNAATDATAEEGQAGSGEWRRSTDAAIADAGSERYHPNHVADEMPDPSQPWRSSATDHTGSRAGSQQGHGAGGPTVASALPPRIASPAPAESSAAPSLPPLRSSSPLPGTSAAAPRTPAQQEMDDQSYFASIGSTRAAQAAARRPTSPVGSSNPRYGSSMTGSGSYGNLAGVGAASSGHEPSDGGRKMTAAAFRKGFNRQSSGQVPSPALEHPPTLGGVPSRDGAASPAIAPLAIRKRHSAIPDAEPDEGDDELPSYAPAGSGSHHQQGQGYSDAYDTNSYAHPQPGYLTSSQQQQYYSGSRPGSGMGQHSYASREGGTPVPPGSYAGPTYQ